ncbi:ATP-binding cassette domain-containing protein [Bifidobacterium favimelis]|uniref:ATP-binding cassette domain-containing protein n=1 Tax=Bifidobacterium favimelis TaxID=3122979 RepID=A0ABU8ZMJ2_9BIFI
MAARLECRHWGYRHASREQYAVSDLNLVIPPGQRVLLLGASGIGKSTILSGMAGLLGDDAEGYTDHAAGGNPAPGDFSPPGSPARDSALRDFALRDSDLAASRTGGPPVPEGMADDSRADGVEVEDSDGGVTRGAILVDGVPAARARGRVGLVLQDPDAQVIFQRVGDNVAFGMENMGVSADRIWPRVHECMKAVGLSDLELHRSALHLSGGQLQRLALAGALAMSPGVLLLDEPTANLDPDGVGQIVSAVRQVVGDRRSTMVLVEHRAEPWMDMIDRVLVLGRGQAGGQNGRTVVVADGTPEEVFTDTSLDLAALGVWVPARYRRPGDEVGPIHTEDEPGYPAWEGSGPALLSAGNLAVGRGGRAIAHGIDLGFRTGQITALVGANGAGKSTLAMTLAGLLPEVEGQVTASPELMAGPGGAEGGVRPPTDPDPTRWSSRQLASRISYVFQNPEHQFARGSVLEEVMLAPLRTGMGREAAEAKARDLLARFRLDGYADANPYTLSGGEKRRLTVAAALAAAPQVLILDEPTFGQDRLTWMSMAGLIHSLRADGVCVILVTHDRDLVRALDARVVELVPGGTGRRGGDPGGPVQAGHRIGALRRPEPGEDVGSIQGWQGHLARSVPVEPMGERAEPERPASPSRLVAAINPSFRLIGAFLIAIPLMFSLDWVSACTALVLEVILLLAAGFRPTRILKSTWPILVGAPTSALAIILYGKSGGATLWRWGLINISERSVSLALATALRVLAVGVPAVITMLGVDSTDLADSFTQILHLPERFVYGGLAGMRLFSVLKDDWGALTASRRSRGLGDESRAKAFFPQAFALLVLSIRRSTTLATAMEARGFGGTVRRTHARTSTLAVRDWVYLALCLAVPVASLLVAWWTGAFAFLGN